MSIIRLKSDRILMAAGGTIIDRLQSLGSTTDFPSEDIKELGNVAVVSVVKDVPDVTIDTEAFDTNCELLTLVHGGDPHAATPPTSFVMTAENIKKVNFIFPVREEIGDLALKTGVIYAAQLTALNYRYSVDGNATESMTFMSDNKHWVYQSAAYEQFVGDNSTVTFELDTATYGGARNYGTDKNIIGLVIDGVKMYEGSEAERIAGTKDFNYVAATDDIVFGTVPALNAVIEVIYPCLTQQTFASTVHEGETVYPSGIKGKNIPVVINAGKLDRVQSINVSISYPNINILEMGNENKVAVVIDTPEITGDISILDRDGDAFAKFCAGAALDASNPVYGLEDFDTAIPIEIKILDPDDNTTVLKTLYIPNVEIVGEGHTSRVGDNLTQTFNFKITANTNMTIYRGSKP